MEEEIKKLELQIVEHSQKLAKLRRDLKSQEIPNYEFETRSGKTNLLSLFGNNNSLFVIHNIGQGCRYCTLWADGLNGFLSHLTERFAVVLASKDSPETQQKFANSRGWRFEMVSHGGGKYIQEQSVSEEHANYPGIVFYERSGEKIYRKSSAIFGPGDLFCSFWHVLALAGVSEEEFTPQFNYWKRPEKMDDGGKNLN